jgi:hypothetical protein
LQAFMGQVGSGAAKVEVKFQGFAHCALLKLTAFHKRTHNKPLLYWRQPNSQDGRKLVVKHCPKRHPALY